MNEVSVNEDDLPIFTLYVRASPRDKANIGAVPRDQQYFMAFRLLDCAQRLLLKEVVTINADNPAPDYLKMNVGNALPVVHCLSGGSGNFGSLTGQVWSHEDDIDMLIDSFGQPSVKTGRSSLEEGEAEQTFLNLQTKLNSFIKNKHSDNIPLLKELLKIETFLELNNCVFSINDEMTFADCLLMPRLHHIRVAAKYFKGFEIPKTCVRIWRYLRATYDSDIFRQASPCDEDILQHYKIKLAIEFKCADGNGHFSRSLMTRTFSFEVPRECLFEVVRFETCHARRSQKDNNGQFIK